ncbi:MAG: peptidylprolyl isomerase [Planctomycetes bacterium]|nr:peptidylprolyl isomerase [Planctomycetota bacterium]
MLRSPFPSPAPYGLAALACATLCAVALANDPPAPPAEPAAPPARDAAIAQIDAFIADAKIDKTKADWKSNLPKPPQATFDAGSDYYLILETNKGRLKIKFFPDVAPMHVSNFIYLARLGFFDDLNFHRVIQNFMAQGGCPKGTGTGSPGYNFDGEFNLDKQRHDRPFLLSMANRGPGTDGSQFFLTFKATPWLDGKHTIFGEVVGGQDVMKTLEACGSPGDGGPTERLFIGKASVTAEKR